MDWAVAQILPAGGFPEPRLAGPHCIHTERRRTICLGTSVTVGRIGGWGGYRGGGWSGNGVGG